MLKRLARQPWVCPKCLLKQQEKFPSSRRSFVSQSATTALRNAQSAVSYSAPATTTDDETLRRVFDSQSFWKDFSTRSSQQLQPHNAGLLQNKYLTSPQGFQNLSKDALRTCQKIVDWIMGCNTVEQYRDIVKSFDRLSDQLCRVIDLVDFIRRVHPSSQIQHAATLAHGRMFEYMNILNTTTGLYDQLYKAFGMPEVTSHWTEEETVTARILLKDFQQSAISEPTEIKERFVKLSNDIAELGEELGERMAPEQMSLKFPSKKLKGMDPVAVKRRTSWGTTTIPTFGPEARLAMSTVEDSDVRRAIYLARRTASGSSINIVERLVKARSELAGLAGQDSFAHLTLSDKMSKTPEAVDGFLRALAAQNKIHAKSDLAEMLTQKQSDTYLSSHDLSSGLNVWDREYYSNRLHSQEFAENRPHDVLSEYFSLGTVMQGLSRLFSRLYGVRLVPGDPLPGETWNEDVRRLDVLNEHDDLVAVIYCDLFRRPYKSPNPAHFTLRCSRAISQAEVAEALHEGSLAQDPSVTDLSNALNDGMAITADQKSSTIRQLPTIAFICDFPQSSTSSPGRSPALLSFRQVTTLFHEMGHCLHSVLGQTSLQNVSGTRCATDFAELPSILMEHFAADPSVLGLYARHWESDKPLNYDLVCHELERRRRLRAAAETESQIMLSVLDQRLHGPGVPTTTDVNSKWNSTEVFYESHSDPAFTSLPEPRGMAWQGFFGHLHQYGAVYYSYLFDRAIAAKLFSDVFSSGRSLDRTQGEQYKNTVLQWGGGRDPWHCVADVLGGEKTGYSWLCEGGENAMKEVGRWGTGGLGDAVGI